jgi:hypothetical protein
MAPRGTHRRLRVLGALSAAIAVCSLLAGGATARTHRPQCGYHAHVVASYIVRLHRHRTSGVFGIYLIAAQRDKGVPFGSICVNVISRRDLPLDQSAVGSHRSRMDVVHDGRSIFRGLGPHPQLFSNGIDITLLRGTLAAIEGCPSCYRFEVWPFGYSGKRPELSGRL